ncbi:LysR family transcriptional regulator [Pseudoalteromonas fenneropenaei]|uniref:LysR family transcriptional regulator n=1 Tax=Pseudoalteromonas fenneropenaei TaxID=1737459 RepID=A0ABV7CJ46_9GAMM
MAFSYSAIHTFTVVAETLSFSKAALLLHITPSAVSHQMKLLEQQLGVKLFVRQAKGVQLSAAGMALIEQANRGVAMIQQGVQACQSETCYITIQLAAIPSFAQHWLVPRLPRFYQRHPHINIELHSRDQLVDFAHSHFDAHLHFGDGHYPQHHVEFLSHEYVLPACHNALLQSLSVQNELQTLQHLLMHHDRLEYHAGLEDAPGNLNWPYFLRHLQCNSSLAGKLRRFSHINLVLAAAEQQQGIALLWQRLASDALNSANLHGFSELRQRLPYQYYLVSPKRAQSHELALFRAWLVAEFNH